MKTKLRLLLAACCCMVLQIQIRAQSAGSLDPTFANGGIGRYGITLSSLNSDARATCLQPDGKIVVVGYSSGNNDFSIIRLNSDGTLDNTFDSDGKLLVSVGSFYDEAWSLAIQPNGKIVVVGNSSNSSNGSNVDFSILRLNSDGTLDNSFDGDGKLLVPIGSSADYARSVAIQADGKIIVTGYSDNGSNSSDFSVIRLNSNGALDNSFDGDGKLMVPIGNSSDYARSVAVQADGKIIVAGQSINGNNYDFSVIRLNSDGTLDNSFEGGGKLLVPVGSSNDMANSVAIQPDGKIVMAGQSSNGSNNDFSAIRLNSDGTLDNSFDSDGKLLVPVGSSSDEANSVALQADDKIVIAGYSSNGSNNDFSVIRLNSDGTLDNSFDNDGKLLVPLGSSKDEARSVAIQPDGKIVVAGFSYNGYHINGSDGSDFSLIRLNSNGTLDNSFDSDGKLPVPIGNSYDYAHAVAVQPDGKIVAAGGSYNGSDGTDFSLIRLNSDGTLDNSFDGDGKLLVPMMGSPYGEASSVAIQPDGKIVVAGYGINGNNGDDFYVLRLNSNGTLDNSFDGDGKLVISVGGYDDYAWSVAIQADGKIIVAGTSDIYNPVDGSDRYVFSVIRLNSDGTPDNSFDGDGKLLVPTSSSYSEARSVRIQPDGKIVLAGFRKNGSNLNLSAVRLNSDGTPDYTFDGDGEVVVSLGSSEDVGYSMEIQADGKIVIAGNSGNSGNRDFTVVRLNNNGTLDNSFDGDGKLLVPVGSSDDIANSVAIQADGKILVAGYSNSDFSIIRLNSNGTLDNGFDGDGKAMLGSTAYRESGWAVALQPDGNIVMAGDGNSDDSPGDFIVMRIIGTGTCTTAPGSPGPITGPTNACPLLGKDTLARYSIAAVSKATSYHWTVPAGATIDSGSNGISILVNYKNVSPAGFTTDAIGVSAINNCGTGAVRKLTVTKLIAGMPGVITGPSDVCALLSKDAEIAYSIAPVANATSYNWTVPDGAIITSGQGTTGITVNYKDVSPALFTTDTIRVVAVNNCSISTQRKLGLKKVLPLTPVAITGPTNVCPLLSRDTTVIYSIAAVANVSYNWTVPAVAIITSGQGTASILVNYKDVLPAGFTTDTIRVSATNNCGTSAVRKLTVTRLIAGIPGVITGPSDVCALLSRDTEVEYRVVAATGTSYDWTVPEGAIITSGQGTAIITVNYTNVSPALFTTDTIRVVAVNNCSISAQRKLGLKKLAPLTPVAITGPTNVCPLLSRDTAVEYSIASVTGTSYNWTVPAGAIITSGQGTASILVNYKDVSPAGFTTDTIRVSATNNCGTSAVRKLTVTRLIAGMPGVITGPSDVCALLSKDTEVEYRVVAVTGTSYNWTVPDGAIITSGQGTAIITVNYKNVSPAQFTTDTIRVVAVNNCSISAERKLGLKKVLPLTPVAITGPTNVCPLLSKDTTVIYSIAAVANVSYNWTVPAGAIITSGQGTASILVNYKDVSPSGFTTDAIGVSATNNCGTSTQRKLVLKKLLPGTPGAITVATLSSCPNRRIQYLIASMPANATSVAWTVPAAAIVSEQNTLSIVLDYPSFAIADTVRVVGINNCATSAQRKLKVTLPDCPASKTSISSQPVLPKINLVALAVKVSPNPAATNVKIILDGYSGNVTIRLSTLEGKSLLEKKLQVMSAKPAQETINVSHYAAGTYFITITDEKGNRKTEKLIIAR